jgi:hypothetical protein
VVDVTWNKNGCHRPSIALTNDHVGARLWDVSNEQFADALVNLVAAEGGEIARQAIASYFSTDGDGFTGSQFEHLVDRVHPNVVTANDIVAITMLGVTFPARPSRWLLGPEGRAQVSALLSQVPTEVEIWEPEAESLLAEGGPLWMLWDLLKQCRWPEPRRGNGLGGKTKRSKLLHAKRPRLVPIFDQVVERLLPHVGDYWVAFSYALRDPARRETVEHATADAPPQLSLLRRVDVVLWWIGRQRDPPSGVGAAG